MKYSTHARIVFAGSAVLLAAIVAVDWSMRSPDHFTKSAEAILMLVSTIVSVQHCRRFPKGSPALLCAAIGGLGVPFLTAKAGSMFTVVLIVAVVVAWTAIGFVRSFAPARAAGDRAIADLPRP